MIVVWDEPKRRANLEKHGLDFARVREWLDGAVVIPARTSRSGRMRLKLALRTNRGWLVAIVSPLGSEALAVVSLRVASGPERRVLHDG